ncbi:MAG TPA: methionyl-tRNA formyltransferase [Patescibacteria group bacterium]|nr:methionyl-tRNA formyltransferase [Patescibacteria group bacterium]
MKQLKIVFFGTSPYSAQFLDLVTKNGLKIDLVVAAPPKPIGRKQVLTENSVVLLAKELNIPFITDSKELTMRQLNNEAIGLILDYNRLIPPSIINLFPQGIINIHFSKLPQYRGPAPVQATILHGDKKAWISYFLISEKLDEGPILAQTSLGLERTETTGTLYQKLVAKAAKEISQIVTDYLNNKIIPKPQFGPSSDTKKLTTKEAKIDWNRPAEEIERLIRAASPEPGAWTEIRLKTQNLKLKILKAHLENNRLIPDTVQLEGKNPVSWKQFQEGYPGGKLSNSNYRL